jgi:hypothetical protein
MSEPAVLYEKKDGIAFVTMNRPEVRNAINTEMLVRLADAWQDINDDPAVHVAILRGAGDKAFCAGADLDRLVRMMQGLRPPETDFDQRVLNDYSIIYKGLLRNYDVFADRRAGTAAVAAGRDPVLHRHPHRVGGRASACRGQRSFSDGRLDGALAAADPALPRDGDLRLGDPGAARTRV